jgi:hypothetical protein
MSRWFRFYEDALNDPKVQRLSGDMFKAWVNLLCLASHSDGQIKSLADAAFALRIPEPKAAVVITALATAELLDKVEGGYFAPHNWTGRQYKSDVTDPTAAERMRNYRNRQRNSDRNGDRNDDVSVTVLRTDTEQRQIRAEESAPKKNVMRGREGGPKHGAVSPSRGTVFIREGTNDWAAYAEDYRKTYGKNPVVNDDGGHWFKLVGATPLPEPKRLVRQ